MLTPAQKSVVEAPLDAKIFLTGPAGCGKTTAATERVIYLINAGISADSILILTPQRTLQDPYSSQLLQQQFSGGDAGFATVGGLARRMVDLFWPLAAEQAGFAQPDQPPIFLTLETAQYYLSHLLQPKLEEGWFDSLSMDRNRLYSQVVDNLNKSAVIGFDYKQIEERLTAAWIGDPAQKRVYADAQASATLFREYCLQNNLLDYSLQYEIFINLLWPNPTVRNYLTNTYQHIIYDNVEEDIPTAHDLIKDWMPDLQSVLLINDEEGGFRRFLGADPINGYTLREACQQEVHLQESFVMSPEMSGLQIALAEAIRPSDFPAAPEADPQLAFSILRQQDNEDELPRYYPELLDSVVVETERLLAEGTPPSEIAILSPYLSDALRFSLMNRLNAKNIPVRSHRPSRSLREEPASQALLTLAAIAHPAWEIIPSRFDLAYAFQLALNTDLVRAQLLAEIVYRPQQLVLSNFEDIRAETQERITYQLGERYTQLQNWLLAYRQEEPLPFDHFLRKLFGEVLSQPEFGYHTNLDAARTAASLIESAQKFRAAMEPSKTSLSELGREYLAMLADGVIAAQYLLPYQDNQEAVLVSPATTFLMTNRPVSVQFWLDAGASGWYERLSQPLTHPYVLSRYWDPNQVWSDAEEQNAQLEAMHNMLSGLIRRCRQQIYLGISNLGESGYEQRGDLLRAFQKVLQN